MKLLRLLTIVNVASASLPEVDEVLTNVDVQLLQATLNVENKPVVAMQDKVQVKPAMTTTQAPYTLRGSSGQMCAHTNTNGETWHNAIDVCSLVSSGMEVAELNSFCEAECSRLSACVAYNTQSLHEICLVYFATDTGCTSGSADCDACPSGFRFYRGNGHRPTYPFDTAEIGVYSGHSTQSGCFVKGSPVEYTLRGGSGQMCAHTNANGETWHNAIDVCSLVSSGLEVAELNSFCEAECSKLSACVAYNTQSLHEICLVYFATDTGCTSGSADCDACPSGFRFYRGNGHRPTYPFDTADIGVYSGHSTQSGCFVKS